VLTYRNELGIAAAGLALLLSVLYIISRYRSSKKTAEEKARMESERLLAQPAYFTEFVKVCAEFGHQHTADLTLLEFQTTLKERKFYHHFIDDMSIYHYSTRYADAHRDESLEKSLIQEMRRFRKEQQEILKSQHLRGELTRN
jgi:hypothetical protein